MTDAPRQRSALKTLDGDRDAGASAPTRSGTSGDAETSPENLRRIGDAARTASMPKGPAAEAIERATAPVGDDEGN